PSARSGPWRPSTAPSAECATRCTIALPVLWHKGADMTGTGWADELRALCEAVLEGRLTPEQRGRLEALVLSSPQARRFYVEYVQQHAMLRWSGVQEAPVTARSHPSNPLPPASRSPARRRWTLRAA